MPNGQVATKAGPIRKPKSYSKRELNVKRVRCLGWHPDGKEVWFNGTDFHRFCPACSARREREPSPARAATPSVVSFSY